MRKMPEFSKLGRQRISAGLSQTFVKRYRSRRHYYNCCIAVSVGSLDEAIQFCFLQETNKRVEGAVDIDVTKISVDWGDGVLYNREKVWQEYKEMVQMGLIKPEIAVAWYFNLPCKNKKDIENIHQNYMPEIESLLVGDE